VHDEFRNDLRADEEGSKSKVNAGKSSGQTSAGSVPDKSATAAARQGFFQSPSASS